MAGAPVTVFARKLVALLTKLKVLEAGAEIEIHRVRAGRHQRAAGAWSWFAILKSGPRKGHDVAASQWSVREVLGWKAIDIYYAPSSWTAELFPNDEDSRKGG